MKETYFEIINSADGFFIEKYNSKEELLKELNEKIGPDTKVSRIDFTEDLEDTLYDDEAFRLIIKGEIVVPKPKKVVKEYDI